MMKAVKLIDVLCSSACYKYCLDELLRGMGQMKLSKE
jgi:hypothetical protein